MQFLIASHKVIPNFKF